MKKTITEILHKIKNKRIGISDIANELQKRRINIISDLEKRDLFLKTIQDLIDEGTLIPLKNAVTLQQYGRLPSTFTIRKSAISEKFSPISIAYRNELSSLSPLINIDYYATHASQYTKDREFILRIDELIRRNDCVELTANERSYLIFGDEKAISLPDDAAVDGNIILKNLKLTLADIKAKKVYEPFFYAEKNYFSLKDQVTRTILIVENKDTFWTLQHALISGELADVNLIIYGEGYAINKKFSYIESIGGSTSDRYFYFGDLDQEGINIFNSVRKNFPQFDIKPAVIFYNYILKKVGSEKAKPLRKNQVAGRFSLSPFVDFFSPEVREMITKIIDERKYLPQEIFNKTDLEELKRYGRF